MDVPALVHVGIAIAMSGSLTNAQIDSMKDETAALWTRYGVHLTWIDRLQDCNLTELDVRMPPVDIMIEVVADADAPGAESRTHGHITLGEVRLVNHVWSRTVHLALPSVKRIVLDASMGGAPVSAWPSSAFDSIIGRALGRVLAHELGHVLLALPTHTRAGLMRAGFSGADLVAAGRVHLGLNRTLVARLESRRAARQTASVGGAAASR